MNLLQELKNDIVGAALIRDWLGEGGRTVEPNLAEARIAVCMNCPWHQPARWWDVFFKNPIARAIKRTLEYKNRVNLRLQDEDKVGMCNKCSCCLRLKVWVPIERVETSLPLGTIRDCPDFCWMRTESKGK